MVTTIQVDEKTILLLKKLKEELEASSYDETINKIAINRISSEKSMAGSLRRYLNKGETSQTLLRELQKERRKSDRF